MGSCFNLTRGLGILLKKSMAPTLKAGKRPKKASSNGSTAKVPPEQGAGLWKLFPVLMVFVGMVVGILLQPAMDGAIGEASSSKEDGEMHCSQASSAMLCGSCATLVRNSRV